MSTKLSCPHCDEPVPDEPENWGWLPPWMCSMCCGLYGYGQAGIYPIGIDLRPMYPLMNREQASRWGQFNSGDGAYVYAICYPNGLPFYVGKGRALRLVQHARQMRAVTNEKEQVIAKLVEREIGERYTFLGLDLSDEAAFELESNVIAALGIRARGGMLANLAGESRFVPGWVVPSPVAKKASGETEGAHWVSHVDLNKVGFSHKGVIMHCPACRKKVFHPANIELHCARCPYCCCLIGTDVEAVREYWAANRPRVNQVLEIDPVVSKKSDTDS